MTMKRTFSLLLLGLSTLPLAACADDYGYGVRAGYGPGPYAYNGWYDGYYGSIYDGYWGNDGYFYYRRGLGDRVYIRGDRGHFMREAPRGPHNFQPFHGSMSPGERVQMPHFPGGGGGGRQGGGGGGGHRHR